MCGVEVGGDSFIKSLFVGFEGEIVRGSVVVVAKL